ncbi:MAG: ATP-binding protein [Bacteroidota bacterium]
MKTKKEIKNVQNRAFRKIGQANESYNLINENDKILIALSGGVDSFVLLDTLASRLKYLPIKYTIHAIHVVLENLPIQTDTNLIQEKCEKLGVPLHIEKGSISETNRKKTSTCFPCSWNRRKAIFKKAQELGFNKVAMGHHLDDALETLLLNTVHHAEISAIPPKLFMVKGNIEIIRPLILLTEEEVKAYAEVNNIRTAEIKCPFEDESNRKTFKDIIQKIGSMHKEAKINMFNSMANIIPEYLPPKR